jgi:hypothetical protein
MPLRINDAEYRRSHVGVPDSHAAMFRQIAEMLDCMILCRAVGPTCMQLLEHGYDTKGFRVHGKSCDWGPMAGFVLRDPRLNKSGAGKEDFNRREHHHALHDDTNSGWRASTTPLKIFPSRVRWLRNTGKITVQWVRGNRLPDRFEGMATHSSGVIFYYALIPEITSVGQVYGVFIDLVKSFGFRQECELPPMPRGSRFQPMMAMTNPASHRSWPDNDFRNAITGDYDLFAIWPRTGAYDAEGDDRRILGTAHVISQSALIDQREETFVEAQGPTRPGSRLSYRAQATKIGNITNRIYEACQFLNSAIGGAVSTSDDGASFGPFPRRMVCWHSDEAARPGVTDVDLPFIAFTPRRREFCITTIHEFELLIRWAERFDFYVTLAEGWTMAATGEKPNRLGTDYADYVPTFASGAKWHIPRWYNR